jgi:hypothetical protein
MACIVGTNSIDNGLVFSLDSNNLSKSWKGKPLTNYYGDIATTALLRGFRTQHYWDGYRWLVNASYTDPGVPGPEGVFLGIVYRHTSGALGDTWEGNSFGYMLKDLSSVSGNRYTMSCYVYLSPNCNLDAFPCYTESATTNNITVSGYATNYNLNQKGTWQRIARGAISDGNVRWIPVYPQKNGVTDGSFTGFFMWAAPQVEDGSVVSRYAGLDTSYVRSSSQSLIDTTRNNTITIANLTYNQNDTFTFDGTDDHINISPSSIPSGSSISLDVWVNINTVRASSIIEAKNAAGGRTLNVHLPWSDNNIFFDCGSATGNTVYDRLIYATSATQRTGWHNWTFTKNLSTNEMAIYFDGNLVASSGGMSIVPGVTAAATIGSYVNGVSNFYNGQLGVMRIYNRALTATEIRQNFEAIRSRYGV